MCYFDVILDAVGQLVWLLCCMDQEGGDRCVGWVVEEAEIGSRLMNG